MDKRLIFYEDKKGCRPVEVFLGALDPVVRAKIVARVEFLGAHWQELRRPYVDYLENGLYELRVQFAKDSFRVIYAYMFKDYIVLLHAFIKRTGKVPVEDKVLVLKRRQDFHARYERVLVNLKR